MGKRIDDAYSLPAKAHPSATPQPKMYPWDTPDTNAHFNLACYRPARAAENVYLASIRQRPFSHKHY